MIITGNLRAAHKPALTDPKIRALARAFALELVSDKHAKLITDLHVQDTRIRAELDQHAPGVAKARLREAHAIAVDEQNVNSIRKLREVNKNISEAEEENTQMRRTIQRVLKAFHEKQVYSLLNKVFIEAAQRLREYVQVQFEAEKAFAEKCGIEFQPSNAVTLILNTADALEVRYAKMPETVSAPTVKSQVAALMDL